MARELLNTLKNSKLVLDWRKRKQSMAEVCVTIEKVLDQGLPEVYTPMIYQMSRKSKIPSYHLALESAK